MFVVGGFNAYPAEIEQLLLRHPDIADAAVIGTPDARLGEVGRAYVVRRPGATVTGDEVIVRSRREEADYKVPRRRCSCPSCRATPAQGPEGGAPYGQRRARRTGRDCRPFPMNEPVARSSPGETASSMSGKRAKSAGRAVRASIRASGAPRQ